MLKNYSFKNEPGVRKWQFTDKGIKLLNVGNINDGKVDLSATDKHLSVEEATGKYAHFLVDEGDLLIACSGIVVDNFHNKIAFAKKEHLPLCLNTSTMRFRPLEEDVDLNYFKYYLQTVHFTSQLQKLITGSAQLNFGPSHIKKIEFLFPPLKTQQHIASILDDAAALRDKTTQLLIEYDLLAQSIFLEMFGDLVNNQKKWKKVQFQEMFTSIRYGTSSPPIYQDHGIAFIRATNVKNGYIEEKGLVYISEDEASKIEKCRLKEGDLIIVRSGANTGDCSRIPEKYIDAFGGFDIIIEIEEPKSTFVNFLLNTGAAKAVLEPLTRRAGQPHINSRQLSELKLICPPINLQNKFAEKIGLIEQQKSLAKQELQESEDLFYCLLQKAFKGELVN